jgi:hypothetical protein
MLNKEEKKELVWIPARLKKEFDEINDDRQKEFLIVKYIEECKQDLKYSIESLDEDVASFKGSMIKARKAFEDAKNEQLTQSYELWEKFDKELPSITKKVDGVKKVLQPLTEELREINELLGKTSNYQINELLKTLKDIRYEISGSSEVGKMLKFLFANYKQ